MDFPDKSNPQKRTHKVADASLQPIRPTKRLRGFLVQEDPKSIAERVVASIVLPRMKAGLEEAFNSFLAGILWGPGGGRPTSTLVQGTVLRPPGFNYAGVSNTPVPNITTAQTAYSGNTYQDLVVQAQQMAEAVVAEIHDTFNRYRMVTVADIYEMGGISAQPYHNSIGWQSLDGMRVSRVRDGYAIEMPRPSPL